MKLYPIMINLEDMPVLVIGGGEVGYRKSVDLLESGAMVTVISLHFHPLFDAYGQYPVPVMMQREYRYGDMDGYQLVFSATNNWQVNKKIFKEAQEKSVLINSADDPRCCSFIMPSFIRKGDFILSLSTSGASPAYAARLRREFEKIIPDDTEILLTQLKKMRTILKNKDEFKGLGFHERGKVLNAVVRDDDFLMQLADADENKLIKLLREVVLRTC